MRRGLLFATLLCALLFQPVVAQPGNDMDEQNLSMLQGYEAFRNGDWISAMFFLRKSMSYGNASEETWYLLILSEMYAQEYEAAVQDCQQYMTLFPDGSFFPLVEYQHGRALYCAGHYQRAIEQFSAFCHSYPDSEFYPSAVFFIAESFFSEYNYASAKVLYQRLVEDYPAAERTPEARERLQLIAQAEREEKLLYLLRVTGEEYLAAKEDYERQLRKYQSEDSMGLHDQLTKSFSDMKEMRTAVDELQYRNEEQARRIAQLEEENRSLQISAGEARRQAEGLGASSAGQVEAPPAGLHDVPLQEEGVMGSAARYPELEALRAKAAELQKLLDEKSILRER